MCWCMMRGATVKEMQAANAERYIVRLAKNCVARWSYLPENAHGNRRYGDRIRPLARARKGKETAATNDPSETTTFEHDGVTIQVQPWRDVVSVDAKVADEAESYDIWVFLTHAIVNRLFWPPTLRQLYKLFITSILTADLSNNCHWLPSR